MADYRRISMPRCPYCGITHCNVTPSNTNWGKLVSMATGTGSSDVKLKCECCGREYRVTCSIRFFGRKEQ